MLIKKTNGPGFGYAIKKEGVEGPTIHCIGCRHKLDYSSPGFDSICNGCGRHYRNDYLGNLWYTGEISPGYNISKKGSFLEKMLKLLKGG